MTELLGRPLTFGDDAQIEALKRARLKNINDSLGSVHEDCVDCDGEGEVTKECEACDGEGSFKLVECPNCKKRDVNIAELSQSGLIVCGYCSFNLESI